MAYYGHIIQCNVLKRLYRYVPSSATFSPIIIRVAALCADNICMETLLIIFAWLLHDEWVVGKLPLMLRRPPHDHDRCLLKVSTKFRGIFYNFTDKATSTVLSSSLIAPGRIAHSLLVQSAQSSY